MKEIRLRIFGEAVIEVGDTKVTPTSSHIFALLLLLTLGPKEGWTRRELMELLFEGVEAKDASHRLRQLLYKLRGMGVELVEERGGLVRLQHRVQAPSEIAEQELSRSSTKSTVEPLSHYEASISRSYCDWIEEITAQLRRVVCSALEDAVAASSLKADWKTSSHLASLLLQLDEANVSAAVAAAEGLNMQGLRAESLRLLDHFIENAELDGDASRRAQALRRRILQAGSHPRSSPIRGRARTLARLAREWSSAQECGARVVALIGPPGIGKTRIAEAFAEHVSLGTSRIIRQLCDERAQEAPLSLFASLITSLRSLPGSIGVSPTHLRTLDLFTDTRERNDSSPTNSAESEAVRLDLKLAVIDLLEAVTRERPLLLLVDDAQWLDDASIATFTQLANGSNEARLLVVMCFRHRAEGASRLFGAQRCVSQIVPPLDEADMRGILADIAPHLSDRPETTSSIIQDAAGNPFYLNALSRGDNEGSASVPDILQAIATRTHFTLSASARNILDLCIFLDKHATLARVTALAAQSPSDILASLRELESADLISCTNGVIRGPHTLLREALRRLVPSSVEAYIHRQIARELSQEFNSDTLQLALAWDAVQHWLSSGDAQEAVQLALRCADHALDIGEPAAGAELLHRVQGLPLPTHQRVSLLDHLIRLSAIGRRTDILQEALLARRTIAITTKESPATIAQLAIRIFVSRGHFDRDAVSQLEDIFQDESLPLAIRAEACARLMVHADLHFDRRTATDLASHLTQLPHDGGTSGTQLQRASLVFHTTFGSVPRALESARAMLNAHPKPTLDDDNTIARDYAAFALLRLGFLPEAREIALDTYTYMAKKGVRNSAEYGACLLSDIDLSLGQVSSSEKWLTVIEQIAKDNPGLWVPTGSGYYSSAFRISILAGDYSRAELLRAQSARLFQPHFAPRVRAVWLAMGLRLAQLQHHSFPSVEFNELLAHYEASKDLGGQDIVAEALWAALKESDGSSAASTMLRDYLFTARRELGMPDWNLATTAADDPSMQEYLSIQRVRAFN